MLYYEIKGEGYPLVLLHGNQEDHHIYDQLVQDLDYQCLLIDTRYHGQSIKSGEVSIEQFSQDVIEVIDHLGIKEYDLCGYSDGANIGMSIALKDKRLQHLVLLSPNSHPKALKPYIYYSFWLQVICLLPFCIYHKQARIKRKLIMFMLKEPHFTDNELKMIKQPVLLLSASQDVIKESDFKYIENTFPYCIHEVIQNSTHDMLKDQYKDTSTKIRRYLYAAHNKDNHI